MPNNTRHFLRNTILALILIVVGFVFLVPPIAYRIMLIMRPRVANARGLVSRVRTDQRSLATAIENYYNDHNCYPAWVIGDTGPGGSLSYNFWIAQQKDTRFSHRRSSSAQLPTFLLHGNLSTSRVATLTTPLSYITTYPPAPFAPERGVTFMYWSVYPGQPRPPMDEGTSIGGVGWILVSAGPDRDYDLEGEYDVYNPAIAQPSIRLLAGAGKHGAYTYDPTNGTFSSGDLWRVKQ